MLCIPLSRIAHDDFLVWGAESSDTYFVCIGYRLLVTSGSMASPYYYRHFYTTLWQLCLSTKIKLTVWRIISLVILICITSTCVPLLHIQGALFFMRPRSISSMIATLFLIFGDPFIFLGQWKHQMCRHIIAFVYSVSTTEILQRVVCALWLIWHA